MELYIVIRTILFYVTTIFVVKKGKRKLKVQALAYLYHLLSRLLNLIPILIVQFNDSFPLLSAIFYFSFWFPAGLGIVSLAVYLKTKKVIYKYFFVFALLFYLFGKNGMLDLVILSYLLLTLYNQNKQKSEN